ncbi:hypothetical protein BJV74DRAFT_848808 [Russula compacta]|nr:hypothetical protein BJV74DRAFT_848808 [Russula compacta]
MVPILISNQPFPFLTLHRCLPSPNPIRHHILSLPFRRHQVRCQLRKRPWRPQQLRIVMTPPFHHLRTLKILPTPFRPHPTSLHPLPITRARLSTQLD